MLLSISGLSKSVGDRPLFRNLTFGIAEGEKVAIVGVNGCGKSTLLRIITGKEEKDAGNLVTSNRIKMAVLEQNPPFDPDESILDHIYRGEGKLIRLLHDYRRACEALEHASAETEATYNHLMAEMDRLQAWDYEAQVTSILRELGVVDLDRKMSTLSGGMLKKVELAKALIEESNLLVLDEPTNHLDVETIIWLEEYLVAVQKAVLLITHDRYFLDRVVTKILEIDRGNDYLYEGNYSYYLEKKIEREETLQKQDEKARQFLKQEMKWLQRQPKARSTKQKARVDRARDLQNRETFSRAPELELSVAARRQGKTILEVEHIAKSFGEKKIIADFTYYFKPGERLGIVGPNGSGKSTLLNLLSGALEPDQGLVRPGLNTRMGYFDQISRSLPLESGVLDYIKKNAGETIVDKDGERIGAAKMLERFLFDGRAQHSAIGKLSGGERRRLYLVQILMAGPNFLLLDEPTNDLDIQTLTIFEGFLQTFSGTVVTVSHDRYFMNRVAESLLILRPGGGIDTFTGSYSEFLEQEELRSDTVPAADALSRGKKGSAQSEKKRTQQKSEQSPPSARSEKQTAKLMQEIERLEKEQQRLEEEMVEHATDYRKVQELHAQLQALLPVIEARYAQL